MKNEKRKEICLYGTEMPNQHTSINDETSIYVLLCKGENKNIYIPPYTFFEEEEATQFYEDSYDDFQSPCYNRSLIKVLKVFVLQNGKVVWANKEAIGTGQAQYIAMDFGLHGRPYIYFNTLLLEEQTDIDSLTVARVF